MSARLPRLCLALLLIVFALPSFAGGAAKAAGFPDVPTDAPYAEAVRQLVARGIVRGYADGRFGPEDPLLRAQTAVTIVRAMGLGGGTGARNFSDQGATDAESWAAVRLLADRDIARGFPDGTFQPTGKLTRQQAISFVSRAMVALGQWQEQSATVLFSDVALDHRADVATYVRYVGGVPAAVSGRLGAADVAVRGWYAEVLWEALAPNADTAPQPTPTVAQPSATVPTMIPTPIQSPTATATQGARPTIAPSPANTTPTSQIPVLGSSPTPVPTQLPPTQVPPTATPTPNPVSVSYLRGVNLNGAEFGGDNLPGIYGTHYIYPTSAELDYYKSKGLTLIRLPVRWERLQHSVYAPLDPTELGRLDEFVAAIRAHDMRVIIEPHNFARYNGQLIGTAAVPNSAFSDFWHRVAEHYRGETAIWAYGLMNEPHDTDGHWPAAAQAGVDGIREVDQARLILVPGDGWSSASGWQQNNANLWVSDPADNIMYEAHVYFDADNSGSYTRGYDADGAYPTIGVDRLRPFTNWLKARNARGFLGEYGVPDNDPRWLVVLDNFLGALDSAGLGGTYWAGGPWWGDYPLSIEPRDGRDRPQVPILVRHLSR